MIWSTPFYLTPFGGTSQRPCGYNRFSGSRRAPPNGGRHLPRPVVTPKEDLTGREVEVLRQLALGRSNKEIATALSIGEETVKTHVSNVLAKLQAGNRAQTIVHALKRGVVALEELA